MKAFLLVFLGGGLGSICRYGISLLSIDNQVGFPSKTFLANLLSCMVLGFAMGYLLKNELDDRLKLLIMTGFCGGFSTFSTFSAEVFSLIETNQTTTAIIYILVSVIVCTLVLFGTYLLGQSV